MRISEDRKQRILIGAAIALVLLIILNLSNGGLTKYVENNNNFANEGFISNAWQFITGAVVEDATGGSEEVSGDFPETGSDVSGDSSEEAASEETLDSEDNSENDVDINDDTVSDDGASPPPGIEETLPSSEPVPTNIIDEVAQIKDEVEVNENYEAVIEEIEPSANENTESSQTDVNDTREDIAENESVDESIPENELVNETAPDEQVNETLVIPDVVNETVVNETEVTINQTVNETGIDDVNDTVEEEDKSESKEESIVVDEVIVIPSVNETDITEILNETEPNITNITIQINESSNISDELNLTGNASTLNITTISNITTINATNVTVLEEKPTAQVVIGQPVRFIKKVRTQNNNISNISIRIPVNATVVKITKTLHGQEREINSKNVEVKNGTSSLGNSLTGAVIARTEFSTRGFWDRILEFINRFTGITGFAVSELNSSTESLYEEGTKEVLVEEAADELSIEYSLPGPTAITEELRSGKKLTISSLINYTDVLAFMSIKDSRNGTVKLYHYTDAGKEEVTASFFDLNENGLIDYIEWIVPHLSEQVYEAVIEISEAEHLDENRSFISDIFDEVSQREGIFSEAIYVNEWVRINFTEPLDSKRDITVYARNNDSLNTSIEVYYVNSSVSFARFPIIKQLNRYQIFLNNMTGEHEQFDLKVVNSETTDTFLEFDLIIDPSISACAEISTAAVYTLTADISSTGTCINFSSSNSELDCQGFNITYNSDGQTHGNRAAINNTQGYHNITVRNCEINSGSGGGVKAVLISGISGANVHNNTFINNTIINLGTAAGTDTVETSDMWNSTWINNTIIGKVASGIELTDARNNTFIGNKINITRQNRIDHRAIMLQGTPAGNVFMNNHFNGSGIGVYIFRGDYNHFINNTYYGEMAEILDYDGDDGSPNIISFNGTFGSITWLDNGTGSFPRNLSVNFSNYIGWGLGRNMFIGNNTIAINTSGVDEGLINSSANISLKLIGLADVDAVKRVENFTSTNADIQNAGTDCNGDTCTLIAYTDGTLYFNTTSFSSFAGNDTLSSSCGEVTTDTTLVSDVSSTYHCFNISAHGVTLDCAGYEIEYGTGRAAYGVNNSGSYANVTIKNCNIIKRQGGGAANYGIYNSQGRNLTILNNTIITNGTNSNYAIFLLGGIRNKVYNNTLRPNGTGASNYGMRIDVDPSGTRIEGNIIITNATSTGHGIALSSGVDNVTINNNSIIVDSSTGNAQGIALNNNQYVNITNNNILTKGSSSNTGVYMEGGSSLNLVRNNTIRTNGSAASNRGIYMITSTNNTIIENNIQAVGTTTNIGIYMTTNTNNTIVKNNTIRANGTGSPSWGIRIEDTSSNNTFLNNNITSVTSDFEIYDLSEDTVANFLIYNNTFGEIRWLDNGSGSFPRNLTFNVTNDKGIAVNSSIFIANNTIALNTSAFFPSRINSTANITLRRIGLSSVDVIKRVENFTMINADIQNAGVDCSGDTCTLIAYSGGDLFFNTTSFSSFAGNTTGSPACGEISSDTTLTQDTNSTGNCFNVTGHNVVLNCAGYDIEYATGGNGMGINNSEGYDNFTVKNCVIIGGQTDTGTDNYGIYLRGSINSTLVNNTLHTRGAGHDYPIFLAAGTNHTYVFNNTAYADTPSNADFRAFVMHDSVNNTIVNNTFITNGTAARGIGIWIAGSYNSTITGNKINTFGSTDNYGILISRASHDISLFNNTINTTGTGANNYALWLNTTWNITFSQNRILTNGTSANYGIYLHNGANWSIVENNSINTAGPEGTNHGIYIRGQSTNSSITRNNISTDGSSSNYGIYVLNGLNNTLFNNSVSTNGTAGSNYGIYVGSENNTVLSNTIKTNGTSNNYGIYIADDFGDVQNNSVSADGSAGANYGLYFFAVDKHVVRGNKIVTRGTSNNYGIFVDTGADHMIIENNSFSTIGTTGSNIGFIVSASHNITFRQNRVVTNGTTGNNAVYLSGGDNSTFDNNTLISDGSTDFNEVVALVGTSNNNTFLNNDMRSAAWDFIIYDRTADNVRNYLFYNNSLGEVRWTDNGTGSFQRNLTFNVSNDLGFGFNNNLVIGNNTVALNTSAFSPLRINSTANVTLRLLGLPDVIRIHKYENFSTNSTQVYRNGTNCVGDTCTIITGYTSGTIVFNTTSFSSFAAPDNVITVIESVTINTTDVTTNSTNTNITANVSVTDADGSGVKIIYNWLVNYTESGPGQSIAVLNMPFEMVNGTGHNNTIDYSGYENNASEQSGIAWNSTGGFDGNGSYRFDGVAHHLVIPDNNSLDVNDSLTIVARVLREGAVSQQDIIVSKWDTGANQRAYQMGLDADGGLFLNVSIDGTYTDGTTGFSLTGATPVVDNTYAMVAVTADPSNHTLTIYRDGVLDASLTDTAFTGIYKGTADLLIGASLNSGAAENYFNGHIDDIVIYNRSLTDQEIWRLWLNESKVIVFNETTAGENWTVDVYTNDGTEDGNFSRSNSQLILGPLDSVIPAVSILTPANKTNFSNFNQSFNASILEENIGVVLFSFDNYTGNGFNISSIFNNSGDWGTEANVTAMVEGRHIMTVFANDTNNNLNNTERIYFTVDRTGPNVTIMNASFSTLDTTPEIWFNFTDLSESANCSLWLNLTFEASNSSVSNNTNTALTTSTLTPGGYNAFVNCTDGSGNVGNSSNITLTITEEETTAAASGGGGGTTTTPAPAVLAAPASGGEITPPAQTPSGPSDVVPTPEITLETVLTQQVESRPINPENTIQVSLTNRGTKTLRVTPELKKDDGVLKNIEQIKNKLSRKFSPEEAAERLEALEIIESENVQFIVGKSAEFGKSQCGNTNGISYGENLVLARLLKDRLVDDQDILIPPNQTIQKNLRIQRAISATKKPINLVFTSEGDEILQKEISAPEDLIIGGGVDLIPDRNLIDLYLLIPPVEGSQQEGTYRFEVDINRKQREEYDLWQSGIPLRLTLARTLARLLWGEKTVFAELYGAYHVLNTEGFVFAQQLQYNPQCYPGDYQLVARVYLGNKVIAKNVWDINFQTGKLEAVTGNLAIEQVDSNDEITIAAVFNNQESESLLEIDATVKENKLTGLVVNESSSVNWGICAVVLMIFIILYIVASAILATRRYQDLRGMPDVTAIPRTRPPRKWTTPVLFKRKRTIQERLGQDELEIIQKRLQGYSKPEQVVEKSKQVERIVEVEKPVKPAVAGKEKKVKQAKLESKLQEINSRLSQNTSEKVKTIKSIPVRKVKTVKWNQKITRILQRIKHPRGTRKVLVEKSKKETRVAQAEPVSKWEAELKIIQLRLKQVARKPENVTRGRLLMRNYKSGVDETRRLKELAMIEETLSGDIIFKKKKSVDKEAIRLAQEEVRRIALKIEKVPIPSNELLAVEAMLAELEKPDRKVPSKKRYNRKVPKAARKPTIINLEKYSGKKFDEELTKINEKIARLGDSNTKEPRIISGIKTSREFSGSPIIKKKLSFIEKMLAKPVRIFEIKDEKESAADSKAQKEVERIARKIEKVPRPKNELLAVEEKIAKLKKRK